MRKIKSSPKLKFNVFDISIFILAIVLLLCTYMSINSRKVSLIMHQHKAADVSVSVEIGGIEFANNLKKGDTVYFFGSDEEMGVVKSVEDIYEPKYFKQKDSKTLVKGTTDKIVGKKIVISTNVKSDNDGVFVNGDRFVAHGYELTLTTDKNKGYNAKVTGIDYPQEVNDG